MLDHISITVSDVPSAEPFYDAIMKVLGVVKVGRCDDWLWRTVAAGLFRSRLHLDPQGTET
jgi:hypothetical protein